MERISQPTKPKLSPNYEEQTQFRKVGLNPTFLILINLIILDLELFPSHESEANIPKLDTQHLHCYLPSLFQCAYHPVHLLDPSWTYGPCFGCIPIQCARSLSL